MNRIVALALVLTFISFARFRIGEGVVFEDARSTLSFGFLLVAAYLVGDLLARIRIPKITGYIVVGILFGTHTLAFVDMTTVGELKLIYDLALTFIAFAAGGEMRLGELRPRARSIGFTVLSQLIIVFLGVSTFVVLASSLFPYVDPNQSIHIFVVAALLGTFSLARSPTSAIAIISECKARGPFTETMLGVTVVMDLLAIILFAVVVAFGQALVGSAMAMDYRFVGVVVAEVASSIVCGIALGAVVSFYIRRIRADLAIFILCMAFMVTFFSHQLAEFLDEMYRLKLHLEPMLICVTAGFWVQNFSRGGEMLMEQIDRSSLPIYVVFFALTGAALDVDSLRHSWMIAASLALVRFVSIWVGASVGARLSGDPPMFQRLSGLSYVTQAGVSLGLAGIVIRRFPEWGLELATTFVAVITLNQIFGPICLKYALGAVGEARSRPIRRIESPEA
jgi:Kef-type K+ transport system membrane component KefB